MLGGGFLGVLLRIIEKDGVLGLYAGYSATLFRNLPAGLLSFSSFDYLQDAVLSRTMKAHLGTVSKCLLWHVGGCDMCFSQYPFGCGKD
ncbi:unnamed protein product [Camellia sinensis]